MPETAAASPDPYAGPSFDRVEWYGDRRGRPYDPQTSTDLVFVATRH